MVKRLAALTLAGMFLLGACGDDDSDEAGDDSGGTEATGDQGSGGGGGGAGYTDQMRNGFVGTCTGEEGASESECGCVFDEISRNVPVAEFLEWTEALNEDPSAPPPQGVADAAASCES